MIKEENNAMEAIIDMVSRELGFNRFCGTIAAKNPNMRLFNVEEMEKADVLASRSLSLFRPDALKILNKILLLSDNDLSKLRSYVHSSLSQENKTLEGSLSEPSEPESIDPIMNIEIF